MARNNRENLDTSKKKSKAIPFYGDLNVLSRLRVGNILYLFNISHSSLYRRIENGSFPKPDGKDGSRPYWLTSTIKPILESNL